MSVSEVFGEILRTRGVDGSFLRPKWDDRCRSYLPDIEKVVKRIKKAVKAGEKVLVYGDYDVDGVCAATVMCDGLRLAGVRDVEVVLPDRFVDGYGLSERVVEIAVELKCSLIITVDCGSRSFDVAKKIRDVGIDVIITDHHECDEEVPECVGVVNPKRHGQDESDLRDLAGVGVAFGVVKALVEAEMIEEGQEKWLLDLVVIGTICDSVAITSVNRRLTYYGMKVLGKTRRVGLLELMKVAGVKKWSSETIGFMVGPRLNAAGRIESAYKSLKLLMCDSRVEAAQLAKELNELNVERKKEQAKAVKEIEKVGVGNESVIIVRGKWHEGVVGIVAGKICERYRRPAFVLTEVEGRVLKGSGRSFGEFDLAKMLQECQDVILKGGGHNFAAGVQIANANFEVFCKRVNEYYKKLDLRGQERYLDVSEDVVVRDIEKLNMELLGEIGELEPFGEGNAEPVFLLRDMNVARAVRMGAEKSHLRVDVEDESGKTLKCVGFFARDEWMDIAVGDVVDAWVALTENEWNGVVSVEGRILKLNKST
jgi:single-stranded-DNA-specific exonuclease